MLVFQELQRIMYATCHKKDTIKN